MRRSSRSEEARAEALRAEYELAAFEWMHFLEARRAVDTGPKNTVDQAQ
jgi:hypothetical protein